MKPLFLTSLLHATLSLITAHTRIRVSGYMEIHDSETFGSDEHVRRDKNFPAFYLDFSGSTRTELRWVERMGEEIHIELVFTFTLNNDRPVTGIYDMKLFEGTSESTTDLDGRKTGRGWNFKTPDINGLEDINSQEIIVNNDDEGRDKERLNPLTSQDTGQWVHHCRLLRPRP
jgi:hypothetical protein